MSLQNLFVHPDTTIRKAIEVLNDQHLRIILIVADDQKLLGVLTDSDVRRILLKSESLDQKVSNVMVKEPLVVTPHLSNQEILHLMKQKQIHQIPVVDSDGRVIDIKIIDELLFSELDAEAFLFVGGLGTRLHPLTEDVPKPLIKVGGKEILFTILDGLMEAGISKITLALKHKAEMIRDAIAKIRKYESIVSFVEEKNSLGTAGALSLLDASKHQKPIIIMNGDILTRVNYSSMLKHHLSEENLITVALRTEHISIPYGVVDLEGNRITGIKEKPEIKFFINAGIYIIQPEVLNLLEREQKIDMPDLIKTAISQNSRVGSFPLHEYWIDIGRHSELEKAAEDYDRYFR